MAHQAIYRKWRPTVFEDIVGQEHITRTLRNQIINDKVGHAYLFCGTRGTGKTSCAKVFSRAVNCLNPKDGSPCNECSCCKGIMDGSIMDVKEIDAASNNGVDSIREIRSDVQYMSTSTKYTVYIIDEVHMLSTGAFNALLKTLEEPPENVIFILATTEAHKVPQTILSRCQRFDFKRIRPEDIILRMKEIARGDKLDISEDGYALLARLADGSMRDGLSILERVLSTSAGTVTAKTITDILGISDDEQIFAITDAAADGDVDRILSVIDSVIADGKDIKVFVDSVIAHMRDLLVISVSSNADGILNYSAEKLNALKAQCKRFTFEELSNAVRVLSDAQSNAKWVKSPRVIFELAFIKLTRPETDDNPAAVLSRLDRLESNTAASAPVSVSAVPDKALLSRIDKLERQIAEGFAAAPKPAPKKKEEKPKQPGLRLYNPIPQNELNSDNPIVRLARNWDNLAGSIKGKAPHLTPVFNSGKIAIDREGIIMLYERNKESFLCRLAVDKRDEINNEFQKITQSQYVIKFAYTDEIPDPVDIWSLRTASDGDVPTDKGREEADPLDSLKMNFSSVVEDSDENEFVSYGDDDAEFSQSMLDLEEDEDLDDDDDDDDDDGSEEFLEPDELSNGDNAD